MAVRIGHAAIDERGKLSGGVAGDQTGLEVCTRDWYSKPWTCILRPKDSKVAEKIAVAMEQACANDRVGYDQSQRTTLYAHAHVKNWDISKVLDSCECDCSSLVAVCVNAAGIPVNKEMYTGNEKECLLGTGKFTAFTTKDYINDYKKLRRGDVLLGAGHTAVVLTTYSATKTSAPAPAPAPAPAATAKPVSISATVTGDFKVGAVLNASHFTVKVNMSDGSVKVNPPYWTASPLALNSESTRITVAYQGVFCNVTVKAKPQYRTYKVVKGDNLYKIATNLLGNGNRYTEIVKLNNLKDTNIEIGQTLKIPNK